jgi:hypothetical protein
MINQQRAHFHSLAIKTSSILIHSTSILKYSVSMLHLTITQSFQLRSKKWTEINYKKTYQGQFILLITFQKALKYLPLSIQDMFHLLTSIKVNKYWLLLNNWPNLLDYNLITNLRTKLHITIWESHLHKIFNKK